MAESAPAWMHREDLAEAVDRIRAAGVMLDDKDIRKYIICSDFNEEEAMQGLLREMREMRWLSCDSSTDTR